MRGLVHENIRQRRAFRIAPGERDVQARVLGHGKALRSGDGRLVGRRAGPDDAATIHDESVALGRADQATVSVHDHRARRRRYIPVHGAAAIEREAAVCELEMKPGRPIGRAQKAIRRKSVGHGENDRSDDIDARLAVQGEALQVVNGGLRGAGDTQREAAGTVGGKGAVSARRHGDLADVAVEREVAEGRRSADGLGGRVEDHVACACR